ncbi:uncharacterized protein CLUP02_13674 [Colletotrichum lupini]|uniref:Uncharacterized protein n=1 Tax=Colletotrichum lupini TaxID=145971 RepID=A0A9Q8T4S0_9PEZI|nr:uncharacterized protein CLUP02_13674 [Colletotrichum lupini]UQC88151.1 hypothetical protein CLUP02_13674 [Colletotrichum lupini]
MENQKGHQLLWALPLPPSDTDASISPCRLTNRVVESSLSSTVEIFLLASLHRSLSHLPFSTWDFEFLPPHGPGLQSWASCADSSRRFAPADVRDSSTTPARSFSAFTLSGLPV